MNVERVPLSWHRQVQLGLAVLLAAGLVAATALIVHRRRVEEQKRSKTSKELRSVAEDLIYWHEATGGEPKTVYPIMTTGLGPSVAIGPEDGREFRDEWGQPLIYRNPGPVHRHGWDLYSIGPNGIDEKGSGDDILVGEDVADVTSVGR